MAAFGWDVVLLTTLCCLAGSAFFSGAETGLMSVSRIRLRHLRRRRPGLRTAALQRLLRHPEDPIMTFLIGNNLVNVLLSAVLTAALTARWGERGEWAAGIATALLLTVLGEIVPKTVFREYPERATLAVAPLIRVCMALFAPVSWALRGYGRLWQRLLPGGAQAGAPALGREEMAALLLAHPQPEGEDRRFAEALERFLALGHLDLRRVMTPLAQVLTVPSDATLADVADAAARSGFSRLPVSGPDGQLAGWVLARDLLFVDDAAAAAAGGRLPPGLVRTCLLVDAAMTPHELFEEMQWQRQQMAIVVDAAGGAVGLVTLENLVEAIVGRIEDEFDGQGGWPSGLPGGAATAGGLSAGDLSAGAAPL